jgi:hypothetical protein
MKKEPQMPTRETTETGTTATSVRQMYEHYGRTGYFAAIDMRRVLGDPTQGVEVLPSSEILMASRAHKVG